MNNNTKNLTRQHDNSIRRKPIESHEDVHNQLLKLTLVNNQMKQKIQMLGKKYLLLQNQNNNLKQKLQINQNAIIKINNPVITQNFGETTELKNNIKNMQIHISQLQQLLSGQKSKNQSLKLKILNNQYQMKSSNSKNLQEICHLKDNYQATIKGLQAQIQQIRSDYAQKTEYILNQKIIQMQDQEKINQIQFINKQEERLQQYQLIYQKQLKVAVADYQFEIKRLTEDHATYVTLSQMQKVRMNKQSQEKIANLKLQLQEQNQNWINRFDIRDKQFKNEVQVIRKKLEQESSKTIQIFRVDMKKQINQLQSEKDIIIKGLKKSSSDQIHRLKNQHNRECQELRNLCENKARQLTQRYQNVIRRIQKQNQLKIVSITSQKKTEERLHHNTKNQFQKIKQKMNQQISNLKNQKDHIQEAHNTLVKEKKQLLNQLAKLKTFIQDKQKQYQQTITNLQRSHIQRQDKLKQATKTKIIQILQTQLQKTEQFDTNIKVLQQKQIQQQNLFSGQIQQIKNCFQQRPSRHQDIEAIRHLQQKLWKKQYQLEQICQQLKIHRLELENKQQTYNKIFSQVNNNSNETKIPSEKIGKGMKEFKFRKVGKSLLVGRQSRNVTVMGGGSVGISRNMMIGSTNNNSSNVPSVIKIL